MRDRQLDLFADAGNRAPEAPPGERAAPPAPAELDDAALVARIPSAGLALAPALAAEAGRRRLAAAVPALEGLCRRFAGFGRERPVPEQAAALQALVAIGSRKAAETVARLIVQGTVQGPGRHAALVAAGRLAAPLPPDLVLELLRDPAPELRVAGCRCAGARAETVPALSHLTRDGGPDVRRAALCALGRLGRREAGPGLARLLAECPCAEVIDAVAAVADEDAIVLLARLAGGGTALAATARDALEAIDHPRARLLLDRLPKDA